MNYPSPMDIAESEDKAINALDEALDWPYSREVWDRVDAERVELLAANEALAAELTECREKRERYALQVCLLLDAMREAGVHIDEKWCWCGPTIENHSDDGFTVAVITGPQPYQKPEMMGTITEYPTDSADERPACDCKTWEPCKAPLHRDCKRLTSTVNGDSASAVQPERCCLDYPRCDCNSPPEPDYEWPYAQAMCREDLPNAEIVALRVKLYNVERDLEDSEADNVRLRGLLAETNAKMMIMHNESISLHARLAERDMQLKSYSARLAEATGIISQRALELADTQGQLTEAKRDAARYRWLRNTATTSDWCDLGGLTADRTDEEIDKALGATVSAPAVDAEPMVTYASKSGGIVRYRQYKKDPLPPWAVDVQDELPDSADAGRDVSKEYRKWIAERDKNLL